LAENYPHYRADSTSEAQYICAIHGILDYNEEDPDDDYPISEYGDDWFCDLCIQKHLLNAGLIPVKVK